MKFCLIISLTFFMFILILIGQGSHKISFGQLLQNKSQNSTVYYGCDKYKDFYHCDLIPNKFKSYQITSKSSKIFNSTDIPDFVEGKEGKALEMHANYLKSIIFSNTTYMDPNKFSISFWVKGVSLQNNTETPGFGHIISQMNVNNSAGWSFDMLNMDDLSKESIRFTVYNSNGNAFSTPEIHLPHDNNKFTQITGTFNGTFIKIYKDGKFFGDAKFNGTYNNHINIPLRLGVAANDNMVFFWSGDIDDLLFYNGVLTEQDISKLFYNHPFNDDDLKKEIIGHWRFNGNLLDESGNNRYGQEFTLIASMAFTPDGRLFFSQRDTGMIKIINENGQVNSKPFAFLDDHYSSWEQGLLGLAIDPDFKQNHFIYLYYTYWDKELEKQFNRIVRFTDVNSIGMNKTIIIDKIPASNGFHSGGALAFGPDDKLYVTVGDATQNVECGDLPNSSGIPCAAQNITSLLGKVLRINKDGTIPPDNPYPNSPVFNIGHINMYGIAFDKKNFGIISENGDYLYDEINTIEKGGNYGAPTLQHLNFDPQNSTNSIKPLRSYYIAKCLTNVIYYDGDLIPALKGQFIIGNIASDIVNGQIYALKINDTTHKIIEENVISLYNFPHNEVVALAQSPKGEVYYGAYTINKLDSVNSSYKKQLLFPIKINYNSSIYSIKNLNFDSLNKTLILDIDTKIDNVDFVNTNALNKYKISNYNTNNFIRIEIPHEMMNNITSVNNILLKNDNNQYTSKNLEYNIKDAKSSNGSSPIFNVLLTGSHSYKILIAGTSSKVIP
jgi:glucose/arabinose dehydrogenase